MPRAAVALLLLLMLAKGFVWASVVPIGQSPDEPAHFAYAEDVARTGNLRSERRIGSRALDTALAAHELNAIAFHAERPGNWSEAVAQQRIRTMASIPIADRETQGTHASTATAYPPLYYLLAAGVLKVTKDARFDTSYLSVRLLSVVLATIAILVQLRTFHLVFGDRLRALAAAAVVALMPMYSYITSSVNPDVLVILLLSIALHQLVVIARRPDSLRLHVGFGVAVAFGLLTKQSMIVAIPPYLVLMAILALQRSRRCSRPRILLAGMLAALPSLILSAWWYLLPASGPAGDGGAAAPPVARISVEAIRVYVSFLQTQAYPRYHQSFWGVFGWLDVALPSEIIDIAFALVLMAALALGVHVLNARDWPPLWVWPFALSMATLVGLLSWIEFIGVTTAGEQGYVQGRYLFPLITVYCAFLVGGLTEPFRRSVVRVGFLGVVVAFVAVLQVLALVGTVVPRYTL